jgi:hypothetical protein
MKDRIHQLLPYQVNAATLKATGNADVKFSLDEAGDLLSGARGTTIEPSGTARGLASLSQASNS